MKAREVELLMLPGLGGGTPNHWYRRWAERIETARVVEQDEWWKPEPEPWCDRIMEHVEAATRPVVFMAHSLGTIALAHVAPRLAGFDVRGAFIVAAPDLESRLHMVPEAGAFAPVPREPLPFPSLMAASKTDPYCSQDAAGDLANAWGSLLVDAGDAGHLNADSGHGPWPEGLMTFTTFLSRL